MIVRHLPVYRNVLTEPLELNAGYLEIPTRPGLGFELNEEFVTAGQHK
jgi:L-alanine-DL-glutamate epimerase-like enolase superfamily enzyme